MKDSESFQHASTAALRFLSYRPRSEAEVKSRLRTHFSDRIVQQVIESLKEQKLVDDEAFAILWRNSRESLNPRSAAAIKRELICKGVASVVANSAVQDMDDQHNIDGGYYPKISPHHVKQKWDEKHEGDSSLLFNMLFS